MGRKGWVGVLSRKRCSFGGQGKMGLRKNTRYYFGGGAAVVSLDLNWVFFMPFSYNGATKQNSSTPHPVFHILSNQTIVLWISQEMLFCAKREESE